MSSGQRGFVLGETRLNQKQGMSRGKKYSPNGIPGDSFWGRTKRKPPAEESLTYEEIKGVLRNGEEQQLENNKKKVTERKLCF